MKKLLQIIIFIFVSVLILDPADLIFNLKIPLLGLILLVWLIIKSKQSIKNVDRTAIICFFILLFTSIYGITIAILQSNLDDEDFALGFIKSIVLFCLIFVINDQQINMEKILLKAAVFIPVIVISCYFLYLYNMGLYSKISVFLVVQKNAAMFSLRDYLGFQVLMLYYKTSALLAFPLAYYWDKFFTGRSKIKNILKVILYAVALFLSATRANMIALVVILILIPFIKIKTKFIRMFFIGTIIVGLIAGIFYLFHISVEQKETSATVKSGHITSMEEELIRKPEYFIWGQGLGSRFFSKGSNAYIVQSEWTYFEIIRLFGLPIGLLFLSVFLFPLFVMIKKREVYNCTYFIIAYTCYLFIAGTNPLLVSSTGILTLLIVYSKLFYLEKTYSSGFRSVWSG
ncbi:MAG: hypothetical protein QM640_06550 [Niabella sp.]